TMFYGSNSGTPFSASPLVIQSATATNNTRFQIGGRQNVFAVRTMNTSTWGAWYTLYHSGNLTNVSQLANDSGYITSVPDSFVTKDNISSSALSTTVIDFDNTGNGASILYAGASSTNRPSVS